MWGNTRRGSRSQYFILKRTESGNFYKKRQKGSALITALLITAICAVLATAILINQVVMIHQAQLVHDADQLYLAAQANNVWSLSAMLDKAQLTQNGQRLSSQQLSITIPTRSIANVEVSGILQDANNFFNINALVLTKNQTAFTKLIMAVSPDIPPQTANLIAQSVSNWMQHNAQDSDYLQHKPPYRPGRTAMVNISELKSVLLLHTSAPAFTPALWAKLSPYLIALPTNTSLLNLNNLTTPEHTAPLLYALNENLTLDSAVDLAGCLEHSKPFRLKEDAITSCPLLRNFSGDYLTVDSQYYLVQSHASLPNQQLDLSSLLGVEYDVKNKPYFHVIWQSLG